MKDPTARDLRNAVILAVVITAIATTALLDRSCQRNPDAVRPGPSHSISPH